MADADPVRDLMAKLMEAVEASLSTSTAVRDALAELVRNGYEARLFFVANAEAVSDEDDDEEEDSERGRPILGGVIDDEEALVLREIGVAPDDSELRSELTKLDRDFLKSLNIRPETG